MGLWGYGAMGLWGYGAMRLRGIAWTGGGPHHRLGGGLSNAQCKQAPALSTGLV